MPGQSRIDAPGALHHIIMRGIEKKPIFKDDADRDNLLERLKTILKGGTAFCFAWSLMPNHVHLVVTPYSGFTLPKILHSWKSYSAHEINKALAREGNVWEEEAFDHLVRNERALSKFVDYTENNPVAAGLCERPEDWAFSSGRFRVRLD